MAPLMPFFFPLFIWNTLQVDTVWRHNLDEVEVYRSRALAVSDTGIIALIDRDQSHIVLLNDDGSLIQRISANGQGPGELQSPTEITFCSQDQTFAILDFGNMRLSKWSLAGQFVEEFSLPSVFFNPKFSTRDEVLFIREPFGRNQQSPTVVRMYLGEARLENLWSYQPSAPLVFSKIGSFEGAGEMVWRWNPALQLGVGSEFVAVAFGNDSTIQLLNLKGANLGRPISVALPQFQVTDAQIQEGMDLMPTTMHRDLKAGLVRPESWPAIRNLLIDEAQRIWVFGSHPDLGMPHPFKVVNRQGNLLGEGNVAFLPLAAVKGHLYFLREEADLSLEKVRVEGLE